MSKKLLKVVSYMSLIFAVFIINGFIQPAPVLGVETISLWTGAIRPGSKEAREAFIKKFEAKHPDIKVKVTIVPWGQMNEKLLAAFATNTLPDIFISWSSFPPSYFDQGLTQEITDVIEEIGMDQYSDAQKRVCSVDGKWFASPFAVVPHVLFYRKDWAQEKGLGPPKTWQDWLNMAKAFTEDTNGDGKIDRFGVVGYLTDTEPLYLSNLAATVRATTFDEKLNVTMNTPQWIESLAFLKELWKYSQPGGINIGQTAARVAFVAGAGGTLPTSVSFANVIGSKNPEMLKNIASVPIPRNPKYKSEFTGYGPNDLYYLMSKNMKHRKAAKTYLVEFMSHQNHLEYARDTAIGWVAVRKSVQQSPEYLNSSRLAPYRSFIEAAVNAETGGLQIGHPFGPNKYGGVVFGRAIWTRMSQKLLVDKMSPEDVAAWGQKAVEEIVEDMK